MVFHFFGGKGGVGKTTCAAARAVRASAEGARVLIVSMDPAHSLGDALAAPLGSKPRVLRVGRRSIHGLELDADRALSRWIASRAEAFRTIADRGTYLDREDVDRLMELSLPGVDELIGLLELRRVAQRGDWDLVVVDTAPTGHTLRLLETPEAMARIARVLDEMQAKHRLLAESIAGSYSADNTDRAIVEMDNQAASLHDMLRDKSQCKVTWVLLPEAMSIDETEDALGALEKMGIETANLLVNRVTPPPDSACAQCSPRLKAEAAAIGMIRKRFGRHEIAVVHASNDEPRGAKALRELGATKPVARPSKLPGAARIKHPPPVGAATLLAELAPRGQQHLLLFGGKGGVGKTTCAAAGAIGLARESPRRVLLLSTDPAHSLSDALGVTIGNVERPIPRVPGLYARELDARAAFEDERQRYHDAIDQLFQGFIPGSRFDASYDRRVMEDLIDLAPSGMDEVFAIVTLVDILEPRKGRPRWDNIVVDTAPTGHTLRLLAMPRIAREWSHALLGVLLKYRRVLGLGELASSVLDFARKLRTLDQLLRDESRTSFITVTRAAELPRLETERLVGALTRDRVPCPWILVDAMTIGSCSRCRRLATKEARELTVLSRLASRTRSSSSRQRAIVAAPAMFPPPHGVPGLERWAARWTRIELATPRAK